jgi:hypothetical protein
MQIELRTSDTAWAAAHSTPGRDGRVIVTVPDAATTALTFAGREMIRFDMREIAPELPRDYPNPYTMQPASWIVPEPQQELLASCAACGAERGEKCRPMCIGEAAYAELSGR